MRDMIVELLQYRHLLFALTWRDIRIRYKQTVCRSCQAARRGGSPWRVRID